MQLFSKLWTLETAWPKTLDAILWSSLHASTSAWRQSSRKESSQNWKRMDCLPSCQGNTYSSFRMSERTRSLQMQSIIAFLLWLTAYSFQIWNRVFRLSFWVRVGRCRVQPWWHHADFKGPDFQRFSFILGYIYMAIPGIVLIIICTWLCNWEFTPR